MSDAEFLSQARWLYWGSHSWPLASWLELLLSCGKLLKVQSDKSAEAACTKTRSGRFNENHKRFDMPFIPTPRSRPWLLASFVAVIALGLASRKYPSLFPALLGKYPGDALWALMVFVGWAFFRPRASTRQLATVALAVSFLVEFSQLYQAPWLNDIRRTTMGHLVLGSRFSWPDLAAYTIGVAMGVLFDTWTVSSKRPAQA